MERNGHTGFLGFCPFWLNSRESGNLRGSQWKGTKRTNRAHKSRTASFVGTRLKIGMHRCMNLHFVHILCSRGLLCCRYYAILYPMKAKYICTKDRTRRVIAFLWAMSFALATPIIYGQVCTVIWAPQDLFWSALNIDKFYLITLSWNPCLKGLQGTVPVFSCRFTKKLGQLGKATGV